MRRESVTIGRKTISYLSVAPDGPALRQRPYRTAVFLHAFPLQAAMWEGTLASAPDGWRAIAPDLRGFGETSLPASDQHRMTEFAGDAIDLLDRLQITRAAVIGCSMGGYVLFEMLKSAPNYLGAIGLVSTRPGADSEEGRSNRKNMLESIDSGGVETVAAQMTPKLLGATTQRERPDLPPQVRNLILANTSEGVRAGVRAMMDRADSTSMLDRVDVPAIVVHGAEDTLIPPSEAEGMHRRIPNARLEILPQCGHLPNLEQPAAFSRILWEFLEKL